MTGIIIYIAGCLVNVALVKMADTYYRITKIEPAPVDERALHIVLALSFISTPMIYIQFKEEITWIWNNIIKK